MFNATINDISVIYMTASRCAGGLTKKLDLRSGSQRHTHFVGFFNVCNNPLWKNYALLKKIESGCSQRHRHFVGFFSVCNNPLWKNYALWKKISKWVKFGTSFTHFEIFQTALKCSMFTHFENKMWTKKKKNELELEYGKSTYPPPSPVRTPGFKSRIRLPYPQRVVKGD